MRKMIWLAVALAGCATTTPLMEAIYRSDADAVERLASQGAEVKGEQYYIGGLAALKTTPLNKAAAQGNTRIVGILLAHGADINERRKDGDTALAGAAGAGRSETVEFLLAHGADVSIPGWRGKTAADWAQDRGHPEIANRLREVARGGARPRPAPRQEAYSGIGMTMKMLDEGPAVLLAPESLPAGGAGIRAEDRILIVNGSDVAGLSMDDLVGRIRGPEGSLVRFEVLRPPQESGVSPSRLEFSVTRQRIEPATLNQAMGAAAKARREELEASGDAAAAAGDPARALERYTAALQFQADKSGDSRLRSKVFKSVGMLGSAPEIPQRARTRASKATAYIKAADSDADYEHAKQELWEALKLAPWWADAYVNLGLVEEKLRHYESAVYSLNLYLQAAPDASDAASIRDKIAEFEVRQEKAARTGR